MVCLSLSSHVSLSKHDIRPIPLHPNPLLLVVFVFLFILLFDSGGYHRGFLGLHFLHRGPWDDDEERILKSYQYLLDVEMEGCTVECVYHKIGDIYNHYTDDDSEQQVDVLRYYQRAASEMYYPAYLSQHYYWWSRDTDRAVMVWKEAEEKGLKDERVLKQIIDCLRQPSYTPSAQVLGQFSSKTEMTLYYCDALIRSQPSEGYFLKGYTYWYGNAGLRIDKANAVKIWEEADRLGVANSQTYSLSHSSLAYAYM